MKGLTLSDIKTRYKTAVVKTSMAVGTEWTHRSVEKKSDPRETLATCSQLLCDKGAAVVHWRKDSLLKKGWWISWRSTGTTTAKTERI